MTCRPTSLLMHRVCPPAVTSWVAWTCLAVAAASGCTASAVEVAPPQSDLYFPTGMVISDDDRRLFVVSANADLRYSAGAVHALDLDAIDAVAAQWKDGQTPSGCAVVPTRPTVLGCELDASRTPTPPPIMVPGGAVQIGNFGTAIVAQRLKQGSAPSSTIRLYATVRGDPSMTWMDFDDSTGTMSCGEGGDFPRCAESHRLSRVRNDATLPSLTAEPFYMYLDSAGENLFVTHFTSGYVSLLSAPSAVGSAPLLQDILTSLWAPSRTTGLIGAAGIAARPGDPQGLVYVTSRYEARVALVAVAEGPPVQIGEDTVETRALVRSASFFLNGIEQSGLPGDSRSLSFSPDGNLAYVISRSPPSLQLFDTHLGPTGAPANRLLDLVELCEQPANLAVGVVDGAHLAAVPCFVNGQVWIVDADTLRLEATEESGRGPNGIALSTARKKLYVGNYAEDTITVIDLDPASPTRNRAILRLGHPRSVED